MSSALRVVEYLEGGTSPFGRWFAALNAPAAAKVATALYRLEQGHRSNVRSVGKGVYEYKIDFGPGYRIYFGQEGESLIILLGGGSKKTQVGDIQIARTRWTAYKSRRQKG
jgi:putative addiction module killer protein